MAPPDFSLAFHHLFLVMSANRSKKILVLCDLFSQCRMRCIRGTAAQNMLVPEIMPQAMPIFSKMFFACLQ